MERRGYGRTERKGCRVRIGLGGWERPEIERVWQPREVLVLEAGLTQDLVIHLLNTQHDKKSLNNSILSVNTPWLRPVSPGFIFWSSTRFSNI